MVNFDVLRGCKVILATEDQFTPIYLAHGLPIWGVEIIGPLDTASALMQYLDSKPPANIACISVNLPGFDAAVNQSLLDRGMPHLLFGVPMSSSAWNNAAQTLWPFTAFQVAHELATLMKPPSNTAY